MGFEEHSNKSISSLAGGATSCYEPLREIRRVLNDYEGTFSKHLEPQEAIQVSCAYISGFRLGQGEPA